MNGEPFSSQEPDGTGTSSSSAEACVLEVRLGTLRGVPPTANIRAPGIVETAFGQG